MKNLVYKVRDKYMERLFRYFDECVVADSLIRKLPQLPEHWEGSLIFEKHGPHRLLFIHHSFRKNELEENPLGNFMQIVKEIESRLGIALRKRMSQREYLLAEGFVTATYEGDEATFAVEVRQFQMDKCEIEYQEKTIKIPQPAGFCKALLTT